MVWGLCDTEGFLGQPWSESGWTLAKILYHQFSLLIFQKTELEKVWITHNNWASYWEDQYSLTKQPRHTSEKGTSLSLLLPAALYGSYSSHGEPYTPYPGLWHPARSGPGLDFSSLPSSLTLSKVAVGNLFMILRHLSLSFTSESSIVWFPELKTHCVYLALLISAHPSCFSGNMTFFKMSSWNLWVRLSLSCSVFSLHSVYPLHTPLPRAGHRKKTPTNSIDVEDDG